ncbi:MAG TPA: TonB family protein [Burkholderiaceae bacterium]|nr:TonB family protein [Burkholderiaceae bacterium]
MRVALPISLALHAALLAVRFSSPPPPAPEASTLEVVLVNARTKAAPIKPRLLAQNTLNGGGPATSGYSASPLPRTTEDQTANQVVLAALRQRQARLEKEQKQLFTLLVDRQKTLLAQIERDVPDDSTDAGEDERTQEALVVNAQISALKAAIQRYDARPRQRFVAPSTQAVPYAKYVEAWRKKIELLGTEHYPEQARGKVYGKLRMTVYIKKNGELLRVEIDQPSSHPILNSAAKRIVQLAAPFAPFPPALAKNTDVLAITRTWHFVNSELTTSPQ